MLHYVNVEFGLFLKPRRYPFFENSDRGIEIGVRTSWVQKMYAFVCNLARALSVGAILPRPFGNVNINNTPPIEMKFAGEVRVRRDAFLAYLFDRAKDKPLVARAEHLFENPPVPVDLSFKELYEV